MSDDVIHYSRKGFDDDEDELSQLEALLEPEVRVETGFDSIVFVENTPVVAGDKYDKLVAVLLKIFNTCGRVVPNGLHMPINPESLKTEGYIILLLIVIVQYAP
jgi:translation initiation factor 3 subunit B